MSNLKQVIVIRKDLNMRKGKMVSQGAHASLTAVVRNLHTANVQAWLEGSQTKICVSVNSEAELLHIFNTIDPKIPCALIKDEGRTEFNEPTYTAIAIGPAPASEVDVYTGALPLL